MAPPGRNHATHSQLWLHTPPAACRYHLIVPPPRHCPLVLLLLPLLAGGCIYRDQTGFDAVGPSHRLDAIVLAADQTDDDSLKGLISQLDSDDPAARLLAIRALEKRTGQTLGYEHDAPPYVRNAAAREWVTWYNARPPEAAPGSTAQPTPASAIPPTLASHTVASSEAR